MIKLRNMKVTKVQETETETEDQTSIKYTYTLQDDDKENTLTLKCGMRKEIELGEELDISISTDQTKLDAHVEAEELTDIIVEKGLMDKVVEEIEKKPELADKVKDKLKEYNDLKNQKETLGKTLEKAKAAEKEKEPDLNNKKDAIKAGQKNQKRIPDTITPAEDDTDNRKDFPNKKEDCKYWYRGGLCANSQMEAPFCNPDKCLIYKPPVKKSKAKKDGMGIDAAIKKEKGSPRTPSKDKTPEPAEETPLPGYDVFHGDSYVHLITLKGEKKVVEIGVMDINAQHAACWIDEDKQPRKVNAKALTYHDLIEDAQQELDIFATNKKLEKCDETGEVTESTPTGLKADRTVEEIAEDEANAKHDWEAKDIPSLLL
ncbi:MAG: hypothetical protein ACTSWQ_03230, partial [Candidatus Thorarchaeota archaeon]